MSDPIGTPVPPSESPPDSISRLSVADCVIGGMGAATFGALVAVAATQVGTTAALALAGAGVGLPAVVGGTVAAAHWFISSEDGAE